MEHCDESASNDEGAGNSTQARAKKSTIEDHRVWIIYCGILRWCCSFVLAAGAILIIDATVVSVVKPYAIYNIICSCIHVVSVGPSLRSPTSPASLRPPTSWLVHRVLLLTLTIGSVATSSVMVTMTQEFRNERDPSGTMCHYRYGDYPCESARSQINEYSFVCLGGAIGTL
ncbi:hypothetical protein DPV78_012371 [Talaromyces pinophilus]|nr:hypothetical protein DPV78_012371 [Talaromyces pinophilus]